MAIPSHARGPNSLPLRFLLAENPFTLLGISVDATNDDIRAKVDELELRARLGDARLNRDTLARSAQLLDDPRTRVVIEW